LLGSQQVQPSLPAQQQQQQQQQQQDLLSMSSIFGEVGGAPPVTSAVNTMPTSIAVYLVEKAMQTGSAQWATVILQPTLANVVTDGWLAMVANDKFNPLDELDYVKLIGQVPWNEIGRASVEDVKAQVLVPVQKLLQIAGQKNMLILMNLLCKVIAVRPFPLDPLQHSP
jgi:hypothetical protein